MLIQGRIEGARRGIPGGILLVGVGLEGAEKRAKEAVCWHFGTVAQTPK